MIGDTFKNGWEIINDLFWPYRGPCQSRQCELCVNGAATAIEPFSQCVHIKFS